MSIVIGTARLRLRCLIEEDAGGVIAALNDWAVAQWLSTPPFPYHRQDFDSFFSLLRRDHADGRPSRFAIADPRSNVLVGVVGLETQNDGSGELGYWLVQSAWGCGYASEAAGALVQHAHDRLFLERLTATTDPENARSDSVLRKSGFLCTGTSVRERPSRRGTTAFRTYELRLLPGRVV